MRLDHRRLLTWLAGAAVVLCTPQTSAAEAVGARCLGSTATIVGTPGDDVLTGTPGGDVFVGLGGRDRITGLGGNDRICGDTGDDVLIGGPGNDRLRGSAGADELSGGPGDDTGYGGPGDDFWGGAQNRRSDVDRFFGGSGSDSSQGGDRGRLRLHGGQGDDRLGGGNGSDLLEGGPGNDTLQGYRGNDALRGGAGRDTVSFAGRFWADGAVSSGNVSRMRVDLRRGRARGLGNDRLGGVEAVIPGGNSDVLLGSRRSETFYLSAESLGHDVINGRGGRDTIGPEPDGGYCCPMLRVDLARRSAWYGYVGWPVDPDSTNRVTSIENIIGTHLGDVLLGDRRNNTIDGRAGDDVIQGRAGRDHLFGGDGNDRLDGGLGRNRNDGGPGTDRCRSPAPGAGTRSCEAALID